MTKVYMPSAGPDAWKQFLAKPDLHWVTGYSARSVAYSWESAGGLPPEIAAILEPLLGPAELVLAIPEHKVALPGGRRESQCDVFALVRTAEQLVACAIEGKVNEPFGPTVGEWLAAASDGKTQRLNYIRELLGLPDPVPPDVRYQLLHRTASAVIEAERFHAGAAAMIVHSFSAEKRWFEDFSKFAALLGITAEPDRGAQITLPDGRPLLLGWASGDTQFCAM